MPPSSTIAANISLWSKSLNALPSYLEAIASLISALIAWIVCGFLSSSNLWWLRVGKTTKYLRFVHSKHWEENCRSTLTTASTRSRHSGKAKWNVATLHGWSTSANK